MKMTDKQLIKLLKQNGWELERIQGSHHIMVKGTKPCQYRSMGIRILEKVFCMHYRSRVV